MTTNHVAGWSFTDEHGSFVLPEPQQSNYLYFPLANEAGMMSAVTPSLHGDAKTGQNSYLLSPVSVEDLQNSRAARNFWLYVDGFGPWSATGNSALQISQTFAREPAEHVTLEAGLLWQTVTRENQAAGLKAHITSFVPASDDRVELMQALITNTGAAPLCLTPTAAIPMYGRSADNLRDHRHVTSLLHRIRTHDSGVLVQPTLSFDERSHRPNTLTYVVVGAEGDATPPTGFFPVLEDFIGEGGNLEWPAAVVQSGTPATQAGATVEGYEAFGGLRFREITLAPGESHSYVLILAVLSAHETVEDLLRRYGSASDFAGWLEVTRGYWREATATPAFRTGDPGFDSWMKWVAVQPTLRRLFGNSFLPYHDYGRGGRGWRDLWQDCLALLLMKPDSVRDLLYTSYPGVRIDGSNATLIGSQPGEFVADRNNIPRVWMDHGAWPYLTTRLYLDQSGDLDFLLQGQTYFKDSHTHRCQARDDAWDPDHGTQLRTETGEVYQGTILEHLLVQHLTAFFNVGHFGNNILLEGADWNDGLDMARESGESVAFTALYASNLRDLSKLLPSLARFGILEVELASELVKLLDTLGKPVDYGSSRAKQQRLAEYFASIQHVISGAKVTIRLADLAGDLAAKAAWLYNHIRCQEWLADDQGNGWFNGYYDNNGDRVDRLPGPDGVRMTLTGQVFTLMSGIATDAQALGIAKAADRYLYEGRMGGYRLNTDFGDAPPPLGRCFGFGFGHKENGAMFSHMAVMYANALYQRGLVREGWKVLDGMYQHCQDFAVSRMFPGLPEYISERGRGMYPWLTGSASWYLLTLLNEVFGVKGSLGDLLLEPRLLPTQFDGRGDAAVRARFAGRDLEIIYHNPRALDYGTYEIRQILVNDAVLPVIRNGHGVRIPRQNITDLSCEGTWRLEVELG